MPDRIACVNRRRTHAYESSMRNFLARTDSQLVPYTAEDGPRLAALSLVDNGSVISKFTQLLHIPNPFVTIGV